jgi:hypothetical protein
MKRSKKVKKAAAKRTAPKKGSKKKTASPYFPSGFKIGRGGGGVRSARKR